MDENGKLLGVTGVGIEMPSVSAFLARQQKKYNRTIFLTDTSGIIQTSWEGDDPDSLVLRADQALYRAKEVE
jgi:PleD family two-component response regulator